MLPFVIAEIAFVTLGDLFLRSSRRGHGSIIKKRHAGVPDGEHQKQKRKRHMDKEPAVEPMEQAHLDIEHAPLVAPALDFLDAAAVTLGYAQLHEAKRVVGKTRIIQSHSIAAARLEIRKNLAFDELDQHSFGCRIGGLCRVCGGLWRGDRVWCESWRVGGFRS